MKVTGRNLFYSEKGGIKKLIFDADGNFLIRAQYFIRKDFFQRIENIR